MTVTIRPYAPAYTAQAVAIWNQVVEEGNAFPQMECLDLTRGQQFFQEQSYTGLALEGSGQVVGLYILHPNNVGRCGHLCNASYAVERSHRGQHIGRALVTHCLTQAQALGFRILQFNAVVRSNTTALALYRSLGFVPLGVIPGGFLNKDGVYEDIIPHYHLL